MHTKIEAFLSISYFFKLESVGVNNRSLWSGVNNCTMFFKSFFFIKHRFDDTMWKSGSLYVGTTIVNYFRTRNEFLKIWQKILYFPVAENARWWKYEFRILWSWRRCFWWIWLYFWNYEHKCVDNRVRRVFTKSLRNSYN